MFLNSKAVITTPTTANTKQEALFTATWIPSILTFAIYFKIIARKD